MAKPTELKPWLTAWGDNLPTETELERSVYSFLHESNKNYPDDVALVYFGRKITYAAFFDRIQAAARAYRKAGVKAGDIVTICAVMLPETIYTFYALDLLGATLNLTDPRTSARGLREYIEEVHSKVVCTLDAAYEKIGKAVEGTEVEKVICISPADSLPAMKKIAYRLGTPDKNKYASNVIMWDEFIRRAENDPAVEIPAYDEKHTVMLCHTGGTTGKPKCVMLGDKALNACAVQMGCDRLKRGEVFLNIMPPFIAYGFGSGVHTTLYYGQQIVLIPKFDPENFAELIRQYRPNHMAGVPLHYQILAKDPRMKDFDLSFVRSTGAGGDGIAPQVEDKVNAFLEEHHSPYKLNKGYGMTEVCACVAVSFGANNRLGSVGLPMPYTTVGIFKPDTDEELDFEESGEICVNSPCMMQGYYKMPEETGKVLRLHSDGKWWVHTGDIGKLDKDGYLYVINRIKRVIIRHDGFKVFPFVIESTVCSLPEVQNACAVAIRDRDHDQGFLPFVFVKVAQDVDTAALEKSIRAKCDEELPEYVVPVGYKFVSELPYTGVGKVDYLSLQKQTEDLSY